MTLGEAKRQIELISSTVAGAVTLMANGGEMSDKDLSVSTALASSVVENNYLHGFDAYVEFGQGIIKGGGEKAWDDLKAMGLALASPIQTIEAIGALLSSPDAMKGVAKETYDNLVSQYNHVAAALGSNTAYAGEAANLAGQDAGKLTLALVEAYGGVKGLTVVAKGVGKKLARFDAPKPQGGTLANPSGNTADMANSARNQPYPEVDVATGKKKQNTQPKPQNGSLTNSSGNTTGMANSARNQPHGGATLNTSSTDKAAYHYTDAKWKDAINENGLKKDSYATPNGNLSPTQASIELALPPNRNLPNAKLRIDLDAMRKDGYKIPKPARVSNTVTGADGRVYTRPGGGYEMKFNYEIPPKYISIVE